MIDVETEDSFLQYQINNPTFPIRAVRVRFAATRSRWVVAAVLSSGLTLRFTFVETPAPLFCAPILGIPILDAVGELLPALLTAFRKTVAGHSTSCWSR